MKKMRLPLIVCFAIAVVGIILGSFFDLQISQSIASSTNGFGLAISSIAPTIGFCFLALISGAFIALALQKERKTWMKVLFWILAVGGFGASVFYSGKEYFGVNGFAGAAPGFVGYLIAIVPLSGATYLGYRLFKGNDKPYTWIVLLIAIAAVVLVLVGAVTILKEIMHRPRYRAIAEYGIDFYNWWQPCKNYRDLMGLYHLTSEEFKSYPSGHTAEISISLITLTVVPFVCPKLSKLQLPLFWGFFAFTLLVAFARILAAAHFLSDVSTGLAVSMIFAFIANEIILHVKAFHPDEPAPIEESK